MANKKEQHVRSGEKRRGGPAILTPPARKRPILTPGGKGRKEEIATSSSSGAEKRGEKRAHPSLSRQEREGKKSSGVRSPSGLRKGRKTRPPSSLPSHTEGGERKKKEGSRTEGQLSFTTTWGKKKANAAHFCVHGQGGKRGGQYLLLPPLLRARKKKEGRSTLSAASPAGLSGKGGGKKNTRAPPPLPGLGEKKTKRVRRKKRGETAPGPLVEGGKITAEIVLKEKEGGEEKEKKKKAPRRSYPSEGKKKGNVFVRGGRDSLQKRGPCTTVSPGGRGGKKHKKGRGRPGPLGKRKEKIKMALLWPRTGGAQTSF